MCIIFWLHKQKLVKILPLCALLNMGYSKCFFPLWNNIHIRFQTLNKYKNIILHFLQETKPREFTDQSNLFLQLACQTYGLPAGHWKLCDGGRHGFPQNPGPLDPGGHGDWQSVGMWGLIELGWPLAALPVATLLPVLFLPDVGAAILWPMSCAGARAVVVAVGMQQQQGIWWQLELPGQSWNCHRCVPSWSPVVEIQPWHKVSLMPLSCSLWLILSRNKSECLASNLVEVLYAGVLTAVCYSSRTIIFYLVSSVCM